MTPCDTIKQKLQLYRYPSMLSCVRETYREYGLMRGFYAGYTTALTMNAPYIAIQFATYESLKTVLAGEEKEERKKTIHHLLAGLFFLLLVVVLYSLLLFSFFPFLLSSPLPLLQGLVPYVPPPYYFFLSIFKPPSFCSSYYHFFSNIFFFFLNLGAGGGAIAGAATNPLDVARTRLQTQTSDVAYQGMMNTVKKIYREEGNVILFLL